MEIPEIDGMDKLYQAITVALEIEKCSICLEKLESTVLLWPCTHWFCNKCISTLHKNAKREKVTCPLCKSATSRRKILPFQDKQSEYEDHLQTLIGALSLDLKFDVTSYNNKTRNQIQTDDKVLKTSKDIVVLSPVKKTRTTSSVRVIEVKKKADEENKKRPTRKSGTLNSKNFNSLVVKNNKTQGVKLPASSMLPETPESPKQKKVKAWLDSNKFSQSDQNICVETVVAEVHNAEKDESLCFSEIALQSVSQMEFGSIETPTRPILTKKSIDTPSDVDAIKVINMSANKMLSTLDNVNRNKKVVSMPSVEKFDELFSENRKVQAVKTTYGSKNPYTSTRTRGQRFAVQVDLFKSIDESKGNLEKCSLEKSKNSSEYTFEDFSSGSGEEWSVEKKPRKLNLLSKGKTLQKTLKQKPERRTKNSVNKYVCVKAQRNSLSDFNKHDVKAQKIRKDGLYNENNNKEDKNKTVMKCIANEERSKSKDSVVKGIMDDWNDTKDSKNLFLDKCQTTTEHNVDVVMTEYKNILPTKTTSLTKLLEVNEPPSLVGSILNKEITTPSKEVRSPGWSRLKSTKKEFHLSEKKKLCLKTINTSKSNSSLTNIGISPLLNQSKNSVSSLNKVSCENKAGTLASLDKSTSSLKDNTDETSCNNLTDGQNVAKPQRTPDMRKSLNTSLTSSASGSPFRGFPTPEEKEPFKKHLTDMSSTDIPVTQKPNNIDEPSSPSRKMDNANVTNTNVKVYPSGSLTKGDPMEVDSMLLEDSKFLQYGSNENLMVESKMPEQSSKSLEVFSSSMLEKRNVSESDTVKECSVFSKKRDRDSGIHNESGISSPLRKKICRDVEVQTSPSRMRSVIRDMLKEMCGIDLEDMMNKTNKLDSLKNSDIVVTSPDYHLATTSQDSDKENVNFVSNNQSVSKKCSYDSDIVFGTDEGLTLGQINLHQGSSRKNALRPNFRDKNQLNVSPYVSTGLKELYCDNVDPDAPTQLYKTPVVQKKPLQTSTKEYSVISNPSSSELRRIDCLFDKSDVIFPDETPKGATPWNYSGVDQLDGTAGTVRQFADENVDLITSQSLKEKANKSRRQLDFVEENSNDLFDFERQTTAKLKDDDTNYELNKCPQSETERIVLEKIDELDDIFMQTNEFEGDVNFPGKDKEISLIEKNEILPKHKDVPLHNEIEGDNMTDTSGIVGPSENQCFGDRVNLFNKQINNTELGRDMASSNPGTCSPTNLQKMNEIKRNTSNLQSKNESVKDVLHAEQGSPFMSPSKCKLTSDDCVNGRQDDEESNPASDISYVEGTPDTSLNDGNRQGISNRENYLKTNNQYQQNDDTEFPSKKEMVRSNSFENDGVQKNTDQSKPNEFQDREEAGNANSGSNLLIENTEVEDESLCFASSLLNPQQNQVLACVLGAMGLTYSKNVGPHISHLIVGTKNGCFQNTYKVLLAMALHKPIIRFDWVEEVIRTGGTVPLDPFVALDPSGECGVLRAKTDKNRVLLQDFAVHIYNVNDRVVLKEQIEELIRLCGGIVVKELHDFHNVPRDKFRIIVLSEPPDSLTQGDWRQKYTAVEVMVDWVYNTVGRYRVMPLVPFMMTDATDAVPFLQHEGYPKQLIFDLSIQE